MCLVAQLCLTLCDPVTIAYQASLSMGFSQARTLEWVVISFSRDQTYVFCFGRWVLYHWATREAQMCVCMCVCVCLYKWKEVLFGKLYPKPVVDVQILGQTFAKGQAMFPIFNWRIIA